MRWKRAQLRDRLPISGHRDGLAMFDPVDDLPAVVAELPNGHSTHAGSVSPVRQSAAFCKDGPLTLMMSTRSGSTRSGRIVHIDRVEHRSAV